MIFQVCHFHLSFQNYFSVAFDITGDARYRLETFGEAVGAITVETDMFFFPVDNTYCFAYVN